MAHVSLKVIICALVMLALVGAVPALPNEGAGVPADAALFQLLEGNRRFVANRLQPKHYEDERPELMRGQHPYAIVLACADSRVPPEIIFDETLGRLFVVRVAGHVADPAVLGSIEYAVEHLGAHLLFILGHESCGAVKATIAGGHVPPNIASLLNRISPAVEKTRAKKVEEKLLLDAAIAENVRYQMQMSLFESELLSEAVRDRKLTVAGGVYRLQTGSVEMMSSSVAIERNEPNAAWTRVEETADSHAAPPTKAEDHAPAKVERSHATREAKGHAASPPTDSRKEDKRPDKTQHERPAQTQHEAAARAKPARAALVEDGAAPVAGQSFATLLRAAFERKIEVRLRKSMLMRDERDRCVTIDCRNVPAGETVEVVSPGVLDVMGRRQLRVKYKGRTFYILADESAFDFDAE